MWRAVQVSLIGFLAVYLSGCMAFRTSSEIYRQQDNVIAGLETEIKELSSELSALQEERDREIARLRKAEEQLRQRLQSEIDSKQAVVKMTERGLVIQFLTQVFFDSGKATLKKTGQDTLGRIVSVLQRVDREIRVEGHTDNVPVQRTKYLYASNWELSVARASTVLHFFADNGLTAEKMSLAGYGEYRPIASNDNKEGRRQNRRVEIVILPKLSVSESEAAASNEEARRQEALETKRDDYIK